MLRLNRTCAYTAFVCAFLLLCKCSVHICGIFRLLPLFLLSPVSFHQSWLYFSFGLAAITSAILLGTFVTRFIGFGPQSVESAALFKFPVVFASFIPLNPFIPCFCTRCRESGEREIENICSPIYRLYDVRLNDYDSHSCRNSQLRSEQIKESNTNYIPLLWQWIVHIGLAWM